MKMKKMKDNPVISEVRATRRKISRRFGNSPKRLVAHYRRLEKKMRASGKYVFLDESVTSK